MTKIKHTLMKNIFRNGFDKMTFLLHAQRIITYKEKKYSKHYTYHAFLYMLDNLLILFSWYHIYHAFCWWQRGRNIWIDAINTDAMIMPCLHHQEIYEKMPYIEMQHLLKYKKCVHHVMISKSYFTALHVDILQYDELLQLPSFKIVM